MCIGTGRILGCLYQDLSEATRKRYALLQTPEFVEEFILDRTLTPAINEFGYREVRMIDPTCGSGHFLLGGFHRLVEEWSSNEPGRNRRDIAQKEMCIRDRRRRNRTGHLPWPGRGRRLEPMDTAGRCRQRTCDRPQ